MKKEERKCRLKVKFERILKERKMFHELVADLGM